MKTRELGSFWMGLMAGLGLSALLMLAGCDSVSPEAVAALKAAAGGARERASAFNLVHPLLVAKDDTKAAVVSDWARLHAEGLASQAKTLADFVAALEARKKLEKVSILALQAEAETARANSESYDQMAAHLKAEPPPVGEWIAAHGVALRAQAAVLERVAAAVTPKEK